jgi:hypothetical protein
MVLFRFWSLTALTKAVPGKKFLSSKALRQSTVVRTHKPNPTQYNSSINCLTLNTRWKTRALQIQSCWPFVRLTYQVGSTKMYALRTQRSHSLIDSIQMGDLLRCHVSLGSLLASHQTMTIKPGATTCRWSGTTPQTNHSLDPEDVIKSRL